MKKGDITEANHRKNGGQESNVERRKTQGAIEAKVRKQGRKIETVLGRDHGGREEMAEKAGGKEKGREGDTYSEKKNQRRMK